MNKDIIKGNWKIIKGKLQQQWAELTEDEILKMEGNAEELEGVLQKKYGYSKEEASKAIQEFIDSNKFS